jgi:hypothetical protein
MKNKHKTKMEFSKKIFYMITIMTVIIVVYSMMLMWYTKDSSALAYLIPSIFTEMATATGFYYTKAKKENEIKLNKKYGKDSVDNTNETENE